MPEISRERQEEIARQLGIELEPGETLSEEILEELAKSGKGKEDVE